VGNDFSRSVSRAHNVVIAMMATIVCAAFAFAIAFALHAGLAVQGTILVVAFLGVVIGALTISASLVSPEQVTDERHALDDPTADAELARATQAGFGRRPFLFRFGALALGTLGVALLVPLRSLAPMNAIRRQRSRYRFGVPLVRADGSPIRLDALDINSVLTAFPQGATDDSASAVMLIRLPDDGNAQNGGYVAYSKVCTHAGCPVALYKASEFALLCPCHQSEFDVRANAKPVSGPAAKALPQLPIAFANGELMATGDFAEPVGPDGWDRA
jgi:ubiquinol-cytochrome c reductase iron-sulfur subunit